MVVELPEQWVLWPLALRRIGILEVGQTLARVVHSGLVVDRLALDDRDPLLAPFHSRRRVRLGTWV